MNIPAEGKAIDSQVLVLHQMAPNNSMPSFLGTIYANEKRINKMHLCCKVICVR